MQNRSSVGIYGIHIVHGIRTHILFCADLQAQAVLVNKISAIGRSFRVRIVSREGRCLSGSDSDHILISTLAPVGICGSSIADLISLECSLVRLSSVLVADLSAEPLDDVDVPTNVLQQLSPQGCFWKKKISSGQVWMSIVRSPESCQQRTLTTVLAVVTVTRVAVPEVVQLWHLAPRQLRHFQRHLLHPVVNSRSLVVWRAVIAVAVSVFWRQPLHQV